MNREALRPVAGHVTTVTFMLCIFYHNKKKGGEGATGHPLESLENAS